MRLIVDVVRLYRLKEEEVAVEVMLLVGFRWMCVCMESVGEEGGVYLFMVVPTQLLWWWKLDVWLSCYGGFGGG